jgi:hypothetical protein
MSAHKRSPRRPDSPLERRGLLAAAPHSLHGGRTLPPSMGVCVARASARLYSGGWYESTRSVGAARVYESLCYAFVGPSRYHGCGRWASLAQPFCIRGRLLGARSTCLLAVLAATNAAAAGAVQPLLDVCKGRATGRVTRVPGRRRHEPYGGGRRRPLRVPTNRGSTVLSARRHRLDRAPCGYSCAAESQIADRMPLLRAGTEEEAPDRQPHFSQGPPRSLVLSRRTHPIARPQSALKGSIEQTEPEVLVIR